MPASRIAQPHRIDSGPAYSIVRFIVAVDKTKSAEFSSG